MRGRELTAVVACCLVIACSDGARGTSASAVVQNTNATSQRAKAPTDRAIIGVDTAMRTLASAVRGDRYRVDSTVAASGAIHVQVSSAAPLPADTVINPDRDETKCKPFVDATFPPHRGHTNNEVGNAVAWLVGVGAGPRDEAPRRVNLRLEKCQLQPRVQRVPVGATIIVNNRDASSSDLRFGFAGQSAAQATLHFTESGQVVPSTEALAKAGLLEIRDVRHPWLRSYIAVAPHPFVAVTGANGQIAWDGVPGGSYQLVVWHERLGSRVIPVVVKPGETLDVRVLY
ncbi:MAG: hypothetical protein M3Y64_10270 [Gemmatimonadota bacterium]|nr:hypothetical protein [Gemmatimonadota bacterium]